MEIVARRLPGIQVDVAPPPPVEALPRMDVAVFVGFGATGPLHVPVAIESAAQFGAVFGPDVPLAWDAGRGERVYGYLAPAVRAFFANGGRRCWVIRVARSLTLEAARLGLEPVALAGSPGVATANVFAVPGILSVAAGGAAVEPALAQATSEGSWSDGLRVSAALAKQGLSVVDVELASPPASTRTVFRTRIGLQTGDLIELEQPDGVTAYAIVDGTHASGDPGGLYAIEATLCAAFERVVQESSPASPPAPWTGSAQVSGFVEPVPATLHPPRTPDETARLRFDAPITASLEPGHWARWSDGLATVWLRIDAIEPERAVAGSPTGMSSSTMDASVRGPAWREVDPVPARVPGTIRRADRLTLELQVAHGARLFRLDPVGLTPRHAAAWWDHVNDAEYYGPPEHVGGGRATPGVAPAVRHFPLCRASQAPALAWIPLGVEPLFGTGVAPLPQRDTALERDGLAAFDASLFVDPELSSASVHVLPELADRIRFLRDDARPLLGVHAAFSIGAGGLFNEATLLAIPDAIHLGWGRRPESEVFEPHPKEAPTPAHWRTHRGACAPADGIPLQDPDFGVFLDCATGAIATPVLFGPDAAVPPGAYRLAWSDVEAASAYVLIEATETDFGDAREIYRGPDTHFIALGQRDGVYYYQVFAERGDDRTAGSNVIPVRVRRDEWVQTPVATVDESMEDQWLAVHRAALRLAAANGDLFVALAMPRHFGTAQAVRYARRLRAVRRPFGDADAAALDFTDARALSYGALYFPWLQADASAAARAPMMSPRAPRVVPPDGVAAGVLADRASRRGAWVAPANEPMRDVVALSPIVPARDWVALQDAQVNVMRFDPRGPFTLSADTLAVDSGLRPINVRRLMILLRRLALRRGTSYAFEPNDAALRRAVQRTFGQLLTDMFQRGAFAGATPAQSFRVVTDDTINTAGDAEAGRFFVELRIAPSQPMRFLALRLTQQGERLTVTEEL